ncbi:MAG TPA: phosphoribosylaminoimidazolesuccinocarboxamide synthase [Solirubrobacterales bacterium]|jgi:phosphoribosylaminoimidazole-succinocarboxamide synthase|nr:phosphoribosylaminoimidazolesuccinocarboxamide synthase [Solirubrobacterales bacterium]
MALDLPLLSSGKVRDTYELPDGDLLMVASDRISTYDAVHPNPIPGKGEVLTGMSVFWFGKTREIVPNHLVSTIEEVPADLRGCALVVKRLEMFPIECVVRGYLAGSGWADYEKTGQVCGIDLPTGLQESSELPTPIFTPATKAEVGDHDENIDDTRGAELVGGQDVFDEIKRLSLAVYNFARGHARERGIILADTKFEFGRDPQTGEIVLGDEVLTPDSSRYWPADTYEPGHGQPSFDKQFVRDWASGTGWDKRPPAPEVPSEIVEQTQRRYVDAYERITDEPFAAWLDRTRGA